VVRHRAIAFRGRELLRQVCNGFENQIVHGRSAVLRCHGQQPRKRGHQLKAASKLENRTANSPVDVTPASMTTALKTRSSMAAARFYGAGARTFLEKSTGGEAVPGPIPVPRAALPLLSALRKGAFRCIAVQPRSAWFRAGPHNDRCSSDGCATEQSLFPLLILSLNDFSNVGLF